jgi:cellulose synthase/poly-beta-1,6-N-acetylglucosamine synthase-like glycosyltransferase
MAVVSIVLGGFAVALVAHSVFSLSLMLDAWDAPERLRATGGPERMREPQLSFTALLPARDEEVVIADTIARVWNAMYPRDLLEMIVICQRDDVGTIAEASRQIDALGSAAVRLAIYDEPPFNKPHALAVGHALSSNDVIAVFDAEDDVDPGIFSLINTVMLEQSVGVVQGGVQLVNLRDHWFSVFNCLEYFFYFRSRMHFNARMGLVPLGGTTVFILRELVDRVGGWDKQCLTEDADIGIRISALGEPVSVVYDTRRVTREETPHSVRSFVKQRTRWNQGFLQILGRGHWRRLPRWRQRALAVFTLSQPLLDALLFGYVLVMPLSLLFLRLPVLAAILTLLPLYVVGFQLLANLVGIVALGRSFGERVPMRLLLRMPFTFLPYQWLLGFSAMRAVVRHVLGRGEWEKTEHRGAHRRVARGQALAQPAALRTSASSVMHEELQT